MKNEKIFAIFLGGFSLALIVFAFAVPAQGLRKKQLDQQTSTALSEVETSLSEYIASNNGDLPKSVKDLDFGEYSSLKNNKSALDRITIDGDKNDYKLCGIFYTDTKTENTKEESGSNIGSTFKYAFGGASAYGSRFSVHDKGNYCFDRENYSLDDYSAFNLYGPSSTSDPAGSATDASNDASRKSEINAIYGKLETFFAENGKYPTFGDINNPNFRSTELSGLRTDNIIDPSGILEQFTDTPTQATYSYEVTPAGCDNTSKDCTGFTLAAILSNGEQYAKESLNN